LQPTFAASHDIQRQEYADSAGATSEVGACLATTWRKLSFDIPESEVLSW